MSMNTPPIPPSEGVLALADAPAAPGKGLPVVAGSSGACISKTATLISAMMQCHKNISDLLFSPGRLPQIEVDGELVELSVSGINRLTPQDTFSIVKDLIGDNQHHLKQLQTHGSTDFSYGIAGVARFRVNVFRQRGSCAVVMRAIPRSIPNFDTLGLPKVMEEIVHLRNGLVLVTGPTGSGKSSTLAAVMGKINEQRAIHILTIEDPIEFVHGHRKATIHQRELHMDTPSFAVALRAALRQAPKIILVGEMRDRETIEVALEAAETGHLVMSTLHTVDASKTIERIIGVFPLAEQQGVRVRLAKTFRFIVSQRLIPRKTGGRVAVLEVLKATVRTREYVEKGENEGKTLLDAMRDGSEDGMQHFDEEIERLIRTGIIECNTGLTYATNSGNLHLSLADFFEEQQESQKTTQDLTEVNTAR